MAPSSPKLTASLAGGMSMLALQALTAPFALVGLVNGDGTAPRWLTGLYVALELGAIVSALLVFWGTRGRRPHARVAPALILLPSWAAVAVAGPIVYQGLPGVLFGGFALSMGAITSLPFLTVRACALFESNGSTTPSLNLTVDNRQ